MILGKYIVSKHAVERYEERVGNYSKMSTLQCINSDLHFTKIKRIVNKPNGDIHVFGRHSVEFIFIKTKKGLVLKTVIKTNRVKNKWRMEQRNRQKQRLSCQ